MRLSNRMHQGIVPPTAHEEPIIVPRIGHAIVAELAALAIREARRRCRELAALGTRTSEKGAKDAAAKWFVLAKLLATGVLPRPATLALKPPPQPVSRLWATFTCFAVWYLRELQTIRLGPAAGPPTSIVAPVWANFSARGKRQTIAAYRALRQSKGAPDARGSQPIAVLVDAAMSCIHQLHVTQGNLAGLLAELEKKWTAPAWPAEDCLANALSLLLALLNDGSQSVAPADLDATVEGVLEETLAEVQRRFVRDLVANNGSLLPAIVDAMAQQCAFVCPQPTPSLRSSPDPTLTGVASDDLAKTADQLTSSLNAHDPEQARKGLAAWREAAAKALEKHMGDAIEPNRVLEVVSERGASLYRSMRPLVAGACSVQRFTLQDVLSAEAATLSDVVWSAVARHFNHEKLWDVAIGTTIECAEYGYAGDQLASSDFIAQKWQKRDLSTLSPQDHSSSLAFLVRGVPARNGKSAISAVIPKAQRELSMVGIFWKRRNGRTAPTNDCLGKMPSRWCCHAGGRRPRHVAGLRLG